MDWIATYLWELFIAVEVIFWLSLTLFIIFRYGLGWEKVSKWIITLFIASIAADLFLGWVDYKQTGEFSQFQLIVLIFVIYAITSGYNDFRRLDVWLQKKIAAFKGQPIPDVTYAGSPTHGKKHARYERHGWYLHVSTFIGALILFYFISGPHVQFVLSDLLKSTFYSYWWNSSLGGMYAEPILNQLTKVWFIVLIVDGIISFSYTLSPKKEKEAE